MTVLFYAFLKQRKQFPEVKKERENHWKVDAAHCWTFLFILWMHLLCVWVRITFFLIKCEL